MTPPAKPDAATDVLRPHLTIREIAMEAGVSTATVSRVLNGTGVVKPATRDAVLQVVERHDYISHGMAGALAGAKSMTIGLVIPTITNSIYASSTQAIQSVAHAAGYCVLLGVSEFNLEIERQVIRRLIERRVDGLILTGGERDEALYRLIDRHQIPVVLTWRVADALGRACVAFDNYAAGRLAMEHLWALGHRRIGLVCGRSDVNDRARERKRAYLAVLAENGTPLDEALVSEGDFEFEVGRRAVRRMLAGPHRPTAVFAANDIQAIGALAACREAGLIVPRDLSIIGFDDLPAAAFATPSLTTVRVPATRMGEVAAGTLLGMIRDGLEASTIILPVEFVERETTAPPPARRIRIRRS